MPVCCAKYRGGLWSLCTNYYSLAQQVWGVQLPDGCAGCCSHWQARCSCLDQSKWFFCRLLLRPCLGHSRYALCVHWHLPLNRGPNRAPGEGKGGGMFLQSWGLSRGRCGLYVGCVEEGNVLDRDEMKQKYMFIKLCFPPFSLSWVRYPSNIDMHNDKMYSSNPRFGWRHLQEFTTIIGICIFYCGKSI